MRTRTERFMDFERVQFASYWTMAEFDEQLKQDWSQMKKWHTVCGGLKEHSRNEYKQECLLCPEMNYFICLIPWTTMTGLVGVILWLPFVAR